MSTVPPHGASPPWVLAVTAALVAAVGEDAPPERTPEALASFARAHSPRAQAIDLEAAAVERAAEGAGAFFDPMLSARAAPLSTPGVQQLVAPEPMPFGFEVMLSQRIPLTSRLSSEQGRARALGERARSTARAMLLDLEHDAAQLSCAAWEADATRRVRVRHVEVLAAMADSTRSQIASGAASVGDAQRIDAEAARVQLEVIESEAELAATTAETNALLGREPNAPLPAPPERAPLLGPAPPDVDAGARDEVTASEAVLRASEAEQARADAAWVPDLTATLSWSSMWPLTHQLMVGVALDIPVFNRGRNAEQQSAALMRENAAVSIDEKKRGAAALLEAARARDGAAARMRALLEDKVVPLAQARADTARASLSGGAALDAALGASHELREAEIELVRALGAQCRIRASLWRAAGVSFLAAATPPESP